MSKLALVLMVVVVQTMVSLGEFVDEADISDDARKNSKSSSSFFFCSCVSPSSLRKYSLNTVRSSLQIWTGYCEGYEKDSLHLTVIIPVCTL